VLIVTAFGLHFLVAAFALVLRVHALRFFTLFLGALVAAAGLLLGTLVATGCWRLLLRLRRTHPLRGVIHMLCRAAVLGRGRALLHAGPAGARGSLMARAGALCISEAGSREKRGGCDGHLETTSHRTSPQCFRIAHA